MEIWIPIVIGIVCLAAGFAGGYVYRRNIAEAKIANAEEAVKKMIGDAQKRAETIKKETVLEAKEEAYRIKNENEKELRERRNELQRNERRLLQREETLDKKIDGVATDLSTFETGDYAVTKAQVATNKKNITNLTTNLNGLSKTEKTHYDSLTKKVDAITADSILSTLGMKINSEGALCYVATSI